MLSGNSLRQTVHTHCASVRQAAKLVAALLRVARVTAGLAESNGSLPPGLWLTSPAGWLPRTGISSGTLRLVIEYGLTLPLYCGWGGKHCVFGLSVRMCVHAYMQLYLRLTCRHLLLFTLVGLLLSLPFVWFFANRIIGWIFAKFGTTTTTPVYRPLFQDNLGKPVPER